MFVSTISAPSESVLGAPNGPLALRIKGSQRNGQVVQLQGAKIGIGSARHATLRVCAAGVSPLHCLILRGTQHTIVRRWSSDTRLNGGQFTDAILKSGDRLSIGPIELEVLDSQQRQVEQRRGSRRQEDQELLRRQSEWEQEKLAWEQQRQTWLLQHAEAEQRLGQLQEQLEGQLRLALADREKFAVQRTTLNCDLETLSAERATLAAWQRTLECQQQQLAESESNLAAQLEDVETQLQRIEQNQQAPLAEQAAAESQRQSPAAVLDAVDEELKQNEHLLIRQLADLQLKQRERQLMKQLADLQQTTGNLDRYQPEPGNSSASENTQ